MSAATWPCRRASRRRHHGALGWKRRNICEVLKVKPLQDQYDLLHLTSIAREARGFGILDSRRRSNFTPGARAPSARRRPTTGACQSDHHRSLRVILAPRLRQRRIRVRVPSSSWARRKLARPTCNHFLRRIRPICAALAGSGRAVWMGNLQVQSRTPILWVRSQTAHATRPSGPKRRRSPTPY